MNLMELINDYGKIMRQFGVKKPVFLLTREAKQVLMDPEFKESEMWKPCHCLPKRMQMTPGCVGMVGGVLLIEAMNYNVPVWETMKFCGSVRLPMCGHNHGNHLLAGDLLLGREEQARWIFVGGIKHAISVEIGPCSKCNAMQERRVKKLFKKIRSGEKWKTSAIYPARQIPTVNSKTTRSGR